MYLHIYIYIYTHIRVYVMVPDGATRTGSALGRPITDNSTAYTLVLVL